MPACLSFGGKKRKITFFNKTIRSLAELHQANPRKRTHTWRKSAKSIRECIALEITANTSVRTTAKTRSLRIQEIRKIIAPLFRKIALEKIGIEEIFSSQASIHFFQLTFRSLCTVTSQRMSSKKRKRRKSVQIVETHVYVYEWIFAWNCFSGVITNVEIFFYM